MNFTKRLEGRELQANEFEFVLKKDGVEVERVKNDALVRLSSRLSGSVAMILVRLTTTQ